MYRLDYDMEINISWVSVAGKYSGLCDGIHVALGSHHLHSALAVSFWNILSLRALRKDNVANYVLKILLGCAICHFPSLALARKKNIP